MGDRTMKLERLQNEVYGGMILRRGNQGHSAKINPDNLSLYWIDNDGEFFGPIGYGSMIADDWHIDDGKYWAPEDWK